MHLICEEGYGLKLRGRLWAEIARKTMDWSCEEGYGLKLWESLCAFLARKAVGWSCDEGWGRLCAEVVRKSVRISSEEGYEFELRGRLWAEVLRKGVITFMYMFQCYKLFQSEKYSIYFMAAPSTGGLLLWKPASARVFHDSCAAKDSYKKKRALYIMTYMLLFVIYRNCFHLTLVPAYGPSVSKLCIYELIRIAENHKNK
jgi:hypothetical protein